MTRIRAFVSSDRDLFEVKHTPLVAFSPFVMASVGSGNALFGRFNFTHLYEN